MERNLDSFSLKSLNRAIQFIEEQKEINLRGIRNALISNVLSSNVLDNIYFDVLNYVLDIEEHIDNHTENSFDNRIGALNWLRAIREKYSLNGVAGI